ncbi:winged helix-turn-helix transcriptional regulator [Ectopseudomonas alcaliphila]|uniref:winged helix-turn-helix transcriptional regulator n=1 Tax=Ectopseudomonas alcaliphila TaxID=101564 RepID=UPI00278A1657|nr:MULTISPECIES: helix-turn-helix domain-containing protein [Pseudomonas]MDP9939179.1 DNA-binding HxlR family transcriptional regulator [Pseudomonas sp. 3400]MDR7011402.1 DNA-binding HxlR family transcriptional regulator [Pseudomonas alcaliphila]
MVKRKGVSDSPCPVARALDVIGDRWTLLIIRDAFDDVRRFGAFQASLGIARNILADRLRSLEDAGILQAVPASDGSAYQDYVLTPRGESLFPVIVALRQWGEGHLYARGEAHSTLMERATGKPVQRLMLEGRNGKPLSPQETYVKKLLANVPPQ